MAATLIQITKNVSFLLTLIHHLSETERQSDYKSHNLLLYRDSFTCISHKLNANFIQHYLCFEEQVDNLFPWLLLYLLLT